MRKMNDKQQKILEMAKDICRVKLNCNDVCNPISACDALKYAERAIEAGYIKVVRCKDCEYAYMDGDRAYCRNIQTPWYNDYFEVFTEAKDFCNYAKMKGGAECE
jgi:hypothetical protein